MEILPDLFFNFRKNIPKDTLATPIFKIHLNEIKGFRGRFSKVRKTGKGLMLGVEVNPDIRKPLMEACLRNGLIIDWFLFQPATFRIAPPLNITDDEIGKVCKKLEAALKEI